MTVDIQASSDAATLFCALTGHRPYPWQQRCYESLVAGSVPPALDIPTGLGKTAVMALWLIARAKKPGLPRRLVYVVDRRAVVDQASEEARKLSEKLGLGAEGQLRELRDKLGVKEAAKLAVSTLRGRLADNRAWLYDPAAPAIIVGTVDMIGSRLLFGGYRTSRWMRPVHAGLIGCDTLLVIDEAHLVPPFAHLVRAAAHPEGVRKGADRVVPSLHVMTLTATAAGDAAGDTKPLGLSEKDHDHPHIEKLLKAPKPLHLLENATDQKQLTVQFAKQAWALREDEEGRPRRVWSTATAARSPEIPR